MIVSENNSIGVCREDRRAITRDSLTSLMEESQTKRFALKSSTETLKELRRLDRIANACSILLMEEYDGD